MKHDVACQAKRERIGAIQMLDTAQNHLGHRTGPLTQPLDGPRSEMFVCSLESCNRTSVGRPLKERFEIRRPAQFSPGPTGGVEGVHDVLDARPRRRRPGLPHVPPDTDGAREAGPGLPIPPPLHVLDHDPGPLDGDYLDPRAGGDEPPVGHHVHELVAELDDPGDPGTGGLVAVLAADLPFLRAAHLHTLLAAAEGRNGAVLIDHEGHPQWLTGCWHPAPLARAAAGYDGFSLRGLMTPLNPAHVLIDPGPGEPPPWLDCDTDADLRQARAWSAADQR